MWRPIRKRSWNLKDSLCSQYVDVEQQEERTGVGKSFFLVHSLVSFLNTHRLIRFKTQPHFFPHSSTGWWYYCLYCVSINSQSFSSREWNSFSGRAPKKGTSLNVHWFATYSEGLEPGKYRDRGPFLLELLSIHQSRQLAYAQDSKGCWDCQRSHFLDHCLQRAQKILVWHLSGKFYRFQVESFIHFWRRLLLWHKGRLRCWVLSKGPVLFCGFHFAYCIFPV